MTTPRVTVPVEPEFTHYRRSQIAHLRPYVSGETLSDRVSISAADLEAGSPKPGDMIARNPANHDDQWLVAADYFAANFEPVSAAPAPEGGAVRYRHKKRGTEYTLIGVGRAQGELQDDDPVVLYRGDDGGLWVRHQVEFCDGRFEQVSALATREEAPAEAGERLTKIVNSMNLVLSGGWDEYQDCDWGAKPDEAKLDRLDDLLGDFVEALRAKPPAREDAQPVAWRYKLDDETAQALFRPGWNFQEHKPPVQWGPYGRLITEAEPLYTHPAPDALRIAVEALEKISNRRSIVFGRGEMSGQEAFGIATQALAALQAEQKGGA